jgi:hypothetical protein
VIGTSRVEQGELFARQTHADRIARAALALRR